MADSRAPGEAAHDLFVGVDITDQAEIPVGVELLAVIDDDASRLLAPVLQGMQPEGGVGRRVGIAVDAEDPALLA